MTEATRASLRRAGVPRAPHRQRGVRADERRGRRAPRVPAPCAAAVVARWPTCARGRRRSRPPSGATQPPPISVAAGEPECAAQQQRADADGARAPATETATTPFSIIQVRVTLTGGELTAWRRSR